VAMRMVGSVVIIISVYVGFL